MVGIRHITNPWAVAFAIVVLASPRLAVGQAETAQDAVASDARLDSLVAAVQSLTRSQDSLVRALAVRADTVETLGANLQTTAEDARRLGIRSLLAFIVIVLASFAVRASTWLLDRLAERNAARRLLYKRLVPIVRVFIWALAVVTVLRWVFGLEARTLLAAGAALGVAIGFAAQDLVKNIFGGLVIIGDGPFQVGDKISVGGTYGEVSAIGLRSTRIVTPDDNLVTVPNSQIMAGQVANANAGALDCQVVTDLYLPGWVDTRRAQEIAYQAAVTSRFVYLKKPVVVLVRDEVHQTFLTHLKVKAYVQDIRQEFQFMSDVTQRAREAFVEAGLLPAWHGAVAYAQANADEGLDVEPWGVTPSSGEDG